MMIFHLAEVTGPALTLLPRARRLAEQGDLEAVFPTEGAALSLYAAFARTSTTRYDALTLPRSLLTSPLWLARFAQETVRFLRLFRARRPGVVVVVATVLPSALLAAKLARLPVVVYAAEVYDPPEAGRMKRALGHLLCRYTGLLAGVVANSSRTASQFRRARRLTIISPTVSGDLAHGDRKRFREQFVLTDVAPLVVSVGNLTFGRGQDVLIRALTIVRRVLPAAHCLIAGEPHPRANDRAYADSLRALVDDQKLGSAVVFAGFVDETADLYAAADIVVNPARFPEPFGRVALEALVAGRPFIGSRVGAIPEVIRDEVDGLLVEPDDPEELAGAIIRVAQDDELRERLIKQGQSHVREAFDEARATSAFVDFIDTAAAGARD